MAVGHLEERLVANYGGGMHDGPEFVHHGYLALLTDTLVACFISYSSPASGSGDMALIGLDRAGTLLWNTLIANANSGRPLGGPLIVGPRANGLMAWIAPRPDTSGVLHTGVVTAAGIQTIGAWVTAGSNPLRVCLSDDGLVFACDGGGKLHVGTLGSTGTPTAVKSAAADFPLAVSRAGVVLGGSTSRVYKLNASTYRVLTWPWSGNSSSPASDGGLYIFGQTGTGPALAKIAADGASISWQARYGGLTGSFTNLRESGGRLYAIGQYDGRETVFCLELDGTFVWARRDSDNGGRYGSAIKTAWGLAAIVEGTGAGIRDARIVVLDPNGGPAGCELFDEPITLSETTTTDVSLGAATGSLTWAAETWGPDTTRHTIKAQTLTRTPVCHETVLVIPDDDPGGGGLPGDADDASTRDTAVLVFEEETGGWFPWGGIPARDAHWNTEMQRMELLGDGRMSLFGQRGRAYVYSDLVVGFSGFGERWRYKATLHLETDHRGDGSDVDVEFEVDGESAGPTVTKATDSAVPVYGNAGALEADTAGAIGFYSSDGSGGCYRKQPSGNKRWYCVGKNRGRLSRFTLRHHTRGAFEISRLGVTFATRNLQ